MLENQTPSPELRVLSLLPVGKFEPVSDFEFGASKFGDFKV